MARDPFTGIAGTPTESEPLTPAEIAAKRIPNIATRPNQPDMRIPGAMGSLPAGNDEGIWLIDPETGVLTRYTYGDLVDAGWLEPGMSVDQVRAIRADLEAAWNPAPTGGRGRGGGSAGPVYVKPDERLVREAVRGTLAALAGRVDPVKLEELTALYMSESKRAFDLRESEQLDPMESVKAKIRDTSEYKAIHQLRPESVDEMQWISTRVGALKRAGVTDAMAEELGIEQATAGASQQDAAFAGNVATFDKSGKLLDELKNRIQTTTYSAMRLI